jgi:O-antigen/teichoic acid export membrane protein
MDREARDETAAAGEDAPLSGEAAAEGGESVPAHEQTAASSDAAVAGTAETDPGPVIAGSGVRGLRNSAMVLAAQLASRVFALGSVIVIGNSLGPNAFGEMQTAVTYGAIVSVVADLGLSTLYLREGARRPERLGRFLDNMLTLRLPLFAAAILILFGALWLVGLHSLVVATAALLVSSGLQLLLRISFFALQRVKFVVVETVPEALLLLGLVVIGALRHLDASYFIWAYVVSYVAAALYFATVLVAMGVWRPRLRFETSLIGPWLLMALPLAVSYIFATVYWQVDVPILQHFAPATATRQCPNGLAYCEVGWYQLAYKPFQALLVVPYALRTAVFPLLSVYHRQAPLRLAIATEKFYKALFALGLPAAIGVVLLADQYTSLLHLYAPAAPALRLLGITIVFMFVDNANAATLLAMDRQRTYAWIVGIGMLLNIALNAVSIPLVEASHPGYGYWATSANTAVTEIGLVTIGWFALRHAGVTVPVLRLGWRIVPAALLMGGFIVLLRPQGRIATVLVTLAAAALYAALLWLFRVADAEERTLLRRALRRES